MRQIELKVEGMSCGHCVKAVDGALRGVSGARVQRVDLGAAAVEVDDGFQVGALIDALADAGYTAEERT
jgi:copper chaperone